MLMMLMSKIVMSMLMLINFLKKKDLTMIMAILVVDMVDSSLLVGMAPLLVILLAYVRHVNVRNRKTNTRT